MVDPKSGGNQGSGGLRKEVWCTAKGGSVDPRLAAVTTAGRNQERFRMEPVGLVNLGKMEECGKESQLQVNSFVLMILCKLLAKNT